MTRNHVFYIYVCKLYMIALKPYLDNLLINSKIM